MSDRLIARNRVLHSIKCGAVTADTSKPKMGMKDKGIICNTFIDALTGKRVKIRVF